jgi:pentatricopeptide repeat protein
LIRGATDEHFWSATYDGELRDALALESDIAQSIAEKVEVTVTGNERERLTAVRPVAPDVYESYLEGMHALYDKQPSRANIEQGIRYLNEAIRKDPTFARPYLHLANAYDNLGSNFIGVSPEETLPKTISAARKAVELDPNLAEAHAFLGYVETREYRWAEAEAEFKRALELNPNNADTYESFGYWLLAQGRTEEAVVWARRGRELDPYTVSGNDMGFILLCARRYDEAEREYRSVLAMAPDDRNGLWSLGFLMVVNGHAAEAIPILERAVSLSQHSPGVTGTLINAYAQAGRRADAMRLLAELKRRKQAGYVPAMAFVWAYLGLGDREQVFAWLEQAYKEKSNFVQWMKVHPIFDSVRGDPRFADLVHRVGLDKN